MDQVEKLLELYRQTKTPSERRLLFETVRISSPQEFVRLEERILREHVRMMTMERLIQTIAAHRGLALQEAEGLLRDTVLQHLLDRPKFAEALLSPAREPNASDGRAVDVAILNDKAEAPLNAPEQITDPQTGMSHSDAPTPAVTALPRLTPRGIGG